MKQDALAGQRGSELRATEIAQAQADAERIRIGAQANAGANAIQITKIAEANAESIRKVNEAIREGGESYFRYRQIEMLPDIAPAIANALAQAKLVTVSSNSDGAAGGTLQNINSVIQTVLAAQLVSREGLLDNGAGKEKSNGAPAAPTTR